MQLKVFKLKDGKLEYKGIREIQPGDAILEGQTSMSEVSSEMMIRLREGSFAGPTPAELERARQKLKAEAEAKLRASWKMLCPNATEKQLDIMVSGKVPPDKGGLT